MGPVMVGIDIGQKVDPTAIAVLEIEERREEEATREEEYHLVRFLERLPLGTSYPRIAARLAEITANLGTRASEQAGQAVRVRPTIWLDATGVGQPVVDLLKEAGVATTPIYFTHGDRFVKTDTGAITLGKALLVSQLQVVLQTGRILLPKTEEAQTLARELQDYEIRVDEDANDKYGAFKVGTHDDLVTALGLAVVAGQKRRRLPHVDAGAGNAALVTPSRWRGIGENAGDTTPPAHWPANRPPVSLVRRSTWRI